MLSALRSLNDSDFSETANIIPQPYSSYPELESSFSPFNLPAVLVPPEVIEIDGLSVNSEEDIKSGRRNGQNSTSAYSTMRWVHPLVF